MEINTAEEAIAFLHMLEAQEAENTRATEYEENTQFDSIEEAIIDAIDNITLNALTTGKDLTIDTATTLQKLASIKEIMAITKVKLSSINKQ